MKNFIIPSMLLLKLSLTLCAQENIYGRFSMSVSGGWAIPVGTFGNKDIANSLIYTPEVVQNPWVIGIDKSKSGFAEPGYFFNLDMKYMLNRAIGIRLRTGYTLNSVWTDGITQFFTTNYGRQKFEHDDYKIFHLAPGLGYEKKIGNFKLGVGVFSGLALTNYPYYKSFLLFTTLNPPQIWTHSGDRPNLKALLLCTSINIDYQKSSKFNWGLELSYQSSNLDYSMTTVVIPGFSPNPVFNDVLKTSTLNVGLKFQYNFARRQP